MVILMLAKKLKNLQISPGASLVVFGLNLNKYESYSFKMSFVQWPNDFLYICT